MAKNENCKILILLIHLEKDGPPGEIRTPDTQVRSLVLYPAELRADSCLRMQNKTRSIGNLMHPCQHSLNGLYCINVQY